MLLRVESLEQHINAERLGAAHGNSHPAGVAVSTVRAIAYANHGRWVADCPFGCGSARDLSPDRPYWCPNCGNRHIGGLAVGVTWPAQLDAIERELAARPVFAQNWDPSESLDDLKRENEDHSTELIS